MRILLLAYEFPPIIAAQSLRWYYLVNELAALGAKIHVVCPNMPALSEFPKSIRAEITIHRSFAGPYVGLPQALSQLVTQARGGTQIIPSNRASILLKAHRAGRKLVDNLLYPDLRTEWLPFAASSVRRVLSSNSFDVVISSYEPGVNILLAMWALRGKSTPWIVDLGDPIVSPYSPKWRRFIDMRFEKRVLCKADAIVTTTDKVKPLLLSRHNIPDHACKFSCIPQGFPLHQAANTKTPGAQLRIVFTGSFYKKFRNPAEFAQALKSVEDLDIAFLCIGNNDQFRPMFEGVRHVSFLGVRDHFQCLDAQADADVLLNIANDQDYQVPGKLYEYLGCAAPILHLTSSPYDESAELIRNLSAGWTTDNKASDIERTLREIHREWVRKKVLRKPESCLYKTSAFSWQRRAEDYYEVIQDVIDSFQTDS